MNRPSNLSRAGMSVAVGVLSVLLLSGRVHAYNERTHQEMTQNAFDIMRLVAYQQPVRFEPRGTASIPRGEHSLWDTPAGISPSEWHAFMQEVATGAWRVLAADSDLPDSHFPGCPPVAEKKMHNLPSLGADSEFHKLYLSTIGQASIGIVGGDCRQKRRLGSLYRALNRVFPHGELAGSALGVHAAAPDAYEGDWHLFFNPLMTGATGAAVDITNEIFATGVGAVIFGLACLFTWGGDACDFDKTRDFADRANPLPQVVGMLAAPFALGNFGTSYTTGLGHLMNLGPFQQSTFDDIAGFHQERSGWRGRPGVVDASMMVAGDLVGLTVAPRHSDGARDYEICDGTQLLCQTDEVLDAHPPSSYRTAARWRAATLGHQQFTPLDNMAYYGWERARNPNFPKAAPAGVTYVTIAGLARTLHALGDAAAPHHLIGGLGWGHRPYERTVDFQWEDVQRATTGRTVDQYRNARQVLVGALYWRNYMRDHRTDSGDIPVRDTISAMAARNYSYIIDGSEETFGNFRKRIGLVDLPFHAFPYVDMVHGNKDGINDSAIENWLAVETEGIGHLINNSISSSVAFLTAAAEFMPANHCGDAVVENAEACDDGTNHRNRADDNGDGCSSQCQVETGWSCDASWPSVCVRSCGDGIVTGDEECDAGGRPSSTCTPRCTTPVVVL